MRLLHTTTQKLVEKTPEELRKENLRYAILSHTWGPHEVIYDDILHGTEWTKNPSSLSKVQGACRQARSNGYDYIWIDTCCIDKSSSSELSEAINSMFSWYESGDVCYAFIEDFNYESLGSPEKKASFASSRWFTRGWTLQELLAPAHLVFFTRDWISLGEKRAISPFLTEITGIDAAIMTGKRPIESASLAKRMSWMARRRTTRPEDSAYCLMGIFGVNMPMLYGEGGRKAFLRLQEEIMKTSDDQSLFAWVNRDGDPEELHGLLAPSPAAFAHSNGILPYHDWGDPREPYTMTNRGLRIQLHLSAREDGIFVATIDCPVPPNYADSSFLAIYLKKISSGREDKEGQHYARVRAGQFGSVQVRGKLRTIYVRQDQRPPIEEGVFPQHILQLRSGPHHDAYKVTTVLLPPGYAKDIPKHLTLRQSPRSWVPDKWPVAFRLPKGEGQVAAVIIFERDDGERLAVLIGSVRGFQVAFGAMKVESEVKSGAKTLSFETLAREFQPLSNGRFDSDFHSVRASATPVVKDSWKYYLIDIGVEDVGRRLPEMLAQATLGAYSRATGTGNHPSYHFGEIPDAALHPQESNDMYSDDGDDSSIEENLKSQASTEKTVLEKKRDRWKRLLK
ncbi:heterokaryon incompatibility protein-domain-containing protein [Diaporthe sp. PMI_573]|nr:heterokaryon incompatibility protein-domain-containing protein [Diaporthaceae sp. PMI_573]